MFDDSDSADDDDEKGRTVLTISLSPERRERLAMSVDDSVPDLRESDDDSLTISARGEEVPDETRIIRALLWELSQRSRSGR
jgi:hypothetical protein